MLIVHPLLVAQEEVELQGQSVGRRLQLANHEEHIAVHLFAFLHESLHVFSVELHVDVFAQQLFAAEVALRREPFAQGLVHAAYGMLLEEELPRHSSAVSLKHTLPVSEGIINEGLGREGDDRIVEVTDFHRCERHANHRTVCSRLRHGNPVAYVHHVVARQANARHEPFNRVLEDEHEHGRRGTQTRHDGQRIAADDDGDDDDDGKDVEHDAQHSAEGVEILLCRRAAVSVHLRHGSDDALCRAQRHDGDVDGSGARHRLLCHGILREGHGQQPPYYDGRDDMAGRTHHFLVEQHIVPFRLRVRRHSVGERHEDAQAHPVSQQCQRGGEADHHAVDEPLQRCTIYSHSRQPFFNPGFQNFHSVLNMIIQRLYAANILIFRNINPQPPVFPRKKAKSKQEKQ